MHRFLAVAFALTVLGLAPFVAVLGICAQQACCAPSDSLTIESAGCCSELACDERKTANGQPQTAQLSPSVAILAAAAPVTPITDPLDDDRQMSVARPLSQRLASLSTFRI